MAKILPGETDIYAITDAGLSLGRPLEEVASALLGAGVRILHPRLFDGSPDGAFSFLELMDKAEKSGRLYGLAHTGAWHHISTPEELLRVDDAYKKGLAE